jgi:pyruvate dehydrogenase E2 component (dihydrolipoamide acetyltransferase)
MPIEIVVPRLGWSMDEGTFGEWLKKDGEQVKAGDMIFVLEGEKASQEIESFDSGILHITTDAPKPGDTVAVGQLLSYLLADGETAPVSSAPSAAQPQAAAASSAGAKRASGPAARRRARELAGQATGLPTSTQARAPRTGSRIAVTPRARRRARELGVDWSNIRGSGSNGRIRERDVVALAKDGSSQAFAADAPAAPGTQRPATKVRRTIAQRMLAGVRQTAPVTLTTKVDAGQLVALRERLKLEAAEGVPSYSDILVKLVAAALPDCPELNACWHNNGVFMFDEINIAIAVDVEGGLVAPVIKNADALAIDKIAEQSRSLGEQARAGTLSQNQLEGGTFTITNLGMFDIDFFTPIINLPQTAILGVGRIADEPVILDGQVVPGKTLALSLTFDHRVIDGAPAARWLQQLGKMIEEAER